MSSSRDPTPKRWSGRWLLACLCLVYLTTLTSSASASHLPFQNRGLLFQPCVQRELKLDHAQRESMILLERLSLIYNSPWRWPREDLQHEEEPDFMQMSRDHRAFQYSVMDAGQRTRYEQIRNQLRGVSGMYTPRGNKEKLELEYGQLRKLFRLVGIEVAEEKASLHAESGYGAIVKKHFEIRDRSVESALKVLNARQKAIWREMVGAPFHWDERDGYPFIDNALDL